MPLTSPRLDARKGAPSAPSTTHHSWKPWLIGGAVVLVGGWILIGSTFTLTGYGGDVAARPNG